MPAAPEAARRVKELALRRGAAACGVAPAAAAAELARYAGAVKDLPSRLGYLARGLPERQDMARWLPGAASVLVCAFPYWDASRDYAAELALAGEPAAYLRATGRKAFQPELLAAPGAKLSRYALCADYHVTVAGMLRALLADIRAAFPGANGKAFCDTSPVMEKELGRLAGLGFRGRNTLLISREFGSWFFLGGIALDLPLTPDEPGPGGCGDCRLCEKACPTGALEGGRLLPEKCLSYWTTQAKEPAPPEITEAARVSGFVYGCDICQEACPHNGPRAKETA